MAERKTALVAGGTGGIGEGLVKVLLEDGWTAVTKDRKLSAHFEHTIAVRSGKAEILTSL